MAAGIVLPVDSLGRSVPVPRYQAERGLELDYTGSGASALEWEAEQHDVIVLRAVDCRARFRIGPVGIWTHMIAGQGIPQPIRTGETAILEILDDAGRIEIQPLDRSGDAF